MANIKDNKKGFKVIQISRKELVEELGQYGAIGICDYCNETASTGYYIGCAKSMVLPEMLSSMVSSRYLLSGRCKGRKQKF